MRTQRLEKIEDFVYHYQAVTLDQLCDAFKVSKNTIRRDIDEIVKGKKIEKTYGGVRVAKEGITLPSFGDRTVQNLALKNCASCLRLCERWRYHFYRFRYYDLSYDRRAAKQTGYGAYQ